MNIPLNFEVERSEIYMDNAATTIIAPEVVEAMYPYLEERYGNPETVYHLGRESREGIEKAREQIADMLGVNSEEIFFTSGGTEANNWVIKGFNYGENRTLIVSSIEHKSVLEPARWCLQKGFIDNLIELPVDKYGIIDLNMLEYYLNKGGVGLVSIQIANNELGTLQPIEEIGELCKKHDVKFHCDAVQGFGKIEFNASEMAVDLISLSGHKIHGPMGVGALWVKTGIELEPLLHGGGQELGKRSGTHGVPQIVGFGKAAELSWSHIKTDMERIRQIIDTIASDLELSVGAIRNGHPVKRLPNILNMTIPKSNAALVCGCLNNHGICISTGAACGTRGKGSHVLTALGKGYSDCISTFRISLSRFNTDKEAQMLVARIHGALREAKQKDIF